MCSRCLAMCQACCMHSVSPSTLHRSPRPPGGSPPTCRRSSAFQPLSHTAPLEAHGVQDTTHRSASPVPARYDSVKAFCLKTLEKRESYEGGPHSYDTT